jgi:hypothetical protein
MLPGEGAQAMEDGTLTAALLEQLSIERRETHNRVLALVQDLSDDQLAWRPTLAAPPIGFHVWHLARWADLDRAIVEGTPQIWRARDLARAWGFPDAGLGNDDTGTGMGDSVSNDLVLPPKAALLDYAAAAFAALDEALSVLPADSLLQPIKAPENDDSAVKMLTGYLSHDNRHLGMIEALRGALGITGTATN